MNHTYERGYDQGYTDGAKYGQVPTLLCFALLGVGAFLGIIAGLLLSHL